MSLHLCFIIYFNLSYLFASPIASNIRFRSSLCYDYKGNVAVGLVCPSNYVIRTHAAFTGISRNNTCSYAALDCAIHEGRTYKCDGNNKCKVHVNFHQDPSLVPLKCDSTGTSAYFQVEYYCVSSTGRILNIQDSNRHNHPTRDNPNNHPTVNITIDGSVKRRGIKEPESRLRLLGIIGGGSGALLIFITVLAVIVRRLRKRTYPQSPCYTSPSGPGASSVSYPTDPWSDLRHGRIVVSDLSAPGSVSSLFPKQSLRDFQLLRGYPPRGLGGTWEHGMGLQSDTTL